MVNPALWSLRPDIFGKRSQVQGFKVQGSKYLMKPRTIARPVRVPWQVICTPYE